MPRELKLEEHVSLAGRSTLGVGGPARWFAVANATDDIAGAEAWCAEHRSDLFVLGGGSNLVISDHGFDGLVLWNRVRRLGFDSTDDRAVMIAGGGEGWEDEGGGAGERGVVGSRRLSGIPGQVGGTPIQNVGAYGQEVSQAIESVTAYDRSTMTMVELGSGECGFAYRTSRFKGADAGRFVVATVT